MKIISHRGNLYGRIEKDENNPFYIERALLDGFDVEIDVWLIKNKFFLGHDGPVYEIGIDFLNNKRLWCHAKNSESLEAMLNNSVHCFWHESDRFTITSNGQVWCYYNNYHPLGITVLKENEFGTVEIPKNTFGICTDFAGRWRESIV